MDQNWTQMIGPNRYSKQRPSNFREFDFLELFLNYDFQNFEKTDIEYAELRQRYNQTLETMNATVVEQVENDAGGDGSNMDEGKI